MGFSGLGWPTHSRVETGGDRFHGANEISFLRLIFGCWSYLLRTPNNWKAVSFQNLWFFLGLHGTLPPSFRGRSELICTPSPSLWEGVRFGIQSRSPSSSFCVRKDPENFLFSVFFWPKMGIVRHAGRRRTRKEGRIPFKRMSRRMTRGKMIFFRVAAT